MAIIQGSGGEGRGAEEEEEEVDVSLFVPNLLTFKFLLTKQWPTKVKRSE